MHRSLLATLTSALALTATPAFAGAPINDACVDATPLTVGTVTAGSTLGAALDPEAGVACGTPIDIGGVWYSIIGTGNTITVTTCPFDDIQPGGASYNTKLSVFCGACAALSCVDGNDRDCGFFVQSTVSWCTAAGVEYLILVHGADGEQGDFDLSVYGDGVGCATPPDCTVAASGACCFPDFTCADTPAESCLDAGGDFQGKSTECATFDCTVLVPVNDDCTGAIPLAVPSTIDGSTIFASEDSAPFCVTGQQSPGTWYSVIGTGNTMTVTTCNGDPVQPGDGDFDTKLHVFCGTCNASDCCVPNNTPGCDDLDCETAVCAADPFCCNAAWDDICANQATYICDEGFCAPMFCVTGNDDECDVGFLLSTASWCSEAGREYWILVSGLIDQTGDFTLSVYDDGLPCSDPPQCEPCVFECSAGNTPEFEPDCGIPDDTTNGGCNSPINFVGNCCIAHDDVGCDDATCTDLVCTINPSCCSIEWDQSCADTAIDLCGVCADVIFPMMPISCGETYCSTSGAAGGFRDVDWYKLELAEESFVEVTATCGFSAIFGIIDNGGVDSCVGLENFVTFSVTQPCVPETVNAYLTPGTWYMLLAQRSFDPLECETEYEFTVECSQPGACCVDDSVCIQSSLDDCLAAGGGFLGPASSCFTPDGAPLAYTSTPGLSIPDADLAGVKDTIEVADDFVVAEVSVEVDIPHTWIADLRLELVHEDSGVSAVLWRGTCDMFGNLEATFDDDGDPVLCDVPTSGVIDPLEANGTPLRVFEGLSAASAWTLRVADTTPPDTGTLESWTLNLESGAQVPCEEPQGRCCATCPSDCADLNGVTDILDLLLLLADWGPGGKCDLYPAGGNGIIDIDDLLTMLAAWGPCPPECSVTTPTECSNIGGFFELGADCEGDPCF